MAIILCPECGKEISDQAISCPHCGMPMEKINAKENSDSKAVTPDQKLESVVDTEEQAKSVKSKYGVWAFILIVAFGLFLFLLKTCDSSSSSSRNSYGGGSYSSYNTSADAKVCAQDAVTQVLNSPSTAKFCPAYEMTAVSLGGANWKVTGYVDAQNALGTYIRKNWTVTLELTEEGYKHGKVTFDD